MKAPGFRKKASDIMEEPKILKHVLLSSNIPSSILQRSSGAIKEEIVISDQPAKESLYACNICQMGFDLIMELLDHVNKNHDDQGDTSKAAATKSVQASQNENLKQSQTNYKIDKSLQRYNKMGSKLSLVDSNISLTDISDKDSYPKNTRLSKCQREIRKPLNVIFNTNTNKINSKKFPPNFFEINNNLKRPKFEVEKNSKNELKIKMINEIKPISANKTEPVLIDLEDESSSKEIRIELVPRNMPESGAMLTNTQAILPPVSNSSEPYNRSSTSNQIGKTLNFQNNNNNDKAVNPTTDQMANNYEPSYTLMPYPKIDSHPNIAIYKIVNVPINQAFDNRSSNPPSPHMSSEPRELDVQHNSQAKHIKEQVNNNESGTKHPQTYHTYNTRSKKSHLTPASQQVFECAMCKMPFNRPKKLAAHVSQAHPENATYKINGNSVESSRQQNSNILTKCIHCSQEFKKINKHLSGDNSYLDPFPCSKCKAKFTNSCGLQTHLASFHNLQTFQCRKCSKKFNSHTLMKDHLVKCQTPLVPISEIQHKLKESNQQNILISTIKCIQTGKNFMCSKCSKVFNSLLDFNDHYLSCLKALWLNPENQNQALKQNNNNQTESQFEHLCSDCDKAFDSIQSLFSHIANDHSIDCKSQNPIQVSQALSTKPSQLTPNNKENFPELPDPKHTLKGQTKIGQIRSIQGGKVTKASASKTKLPKISLPKKNSTVGPTFHILPSNVAAEVSYAKQAKRQTQIDSGFEAKVMKLQSDPELEIKNYSKLQGESMDEAKTSGEGLTKRKTVFRTNTRLGPKDVHPCQFCNGFYSSQMFLDKHMEKSHSKVTNYSPLAIEADGAKSQANFDCSTCLEKFDLELDFKSHQRQVHSGNKTNTKTLISGDYIDRVPSFY